MTLTDLRQALKLLIEPLLGLASQGQGCVSAGTNGLGPPPEARNRSKSHGDRSILQHFDRGHRGAAQADVLAQFGECLGEIDQPLRAELQSAEQGFVEDEHNGQFGVSS